MALVLPQIWTDVAQLHARFAWAVDRRDLQLVSDQFIDSARFIVPADAPGDAPLVYAGKDEIRARWEGRSDVSRHAFVNQHVEEAGPGRLIGKILLLGYRSDAAGQGDTTAAVVTDFDDIIVLDADGQWRFAERRATIIFARPPQ